MSEKEQLEALIESIREFKNSIKGLSMEVESWRIHTSSNGEFVLCALRDLVASVNRVLDELEKS